MNTNPSFGAGLFGEPKPSETAPESVQTPDPGAAQSPPKESAPVAESPSPAEPDEEAGNADYFVQQERDREKAMLLRRTREEATNPETTEPQRQGQGGRRWERGGGGNRNFDPSRRPRHGSGPSSSMPPSPTREFHEEQSSSRPTAAEAEFSERRSNTERRQGIPSATDPVLLDQRVAVLVDVQNMYHSARKLFGRNLSYSKLSQNIVKGRKLIRAIAYLLDRAGVDQSGFLDHLNSCGFEVRRKEIVERADGTRKGDWNIGMAADAVALSEKVDVLILVSGDGDFVSLAEILRPRGVKVEVASFRESTSDTLIEAADSFHALGKDSLY